MKIYITFGQSHAHHVNGVTFDKDCVAEITCTSHAAGREKAFELFGPKFFTSYEEASPKLMQHFPRGIIKVEP